MSNDEKKVVPFPPFPKADIAPEEPAVEVPKAEAKADVPPEELARRVRVEVERLAGMPRVEWLYYLATDGIAEKYGLSQAEMKKMIEATIKERENTAKYNRAEDRRSEKDKVTARERERAQAAKEAVRKQREKDRALAAILKLPKSAREAKLEELARTLGEDIELLREELALLAGDEEERIASGEIEPWPEPVDTCELLNELEAQFRRYIVVHREQVAVATVLWICFAWCHDIATYSPLLVVEAGDAKAGKTNASCVLAWMAPNPQLAAELRGPTLFRLVDAEHPTLVIDDAERLLPRRPDLAQIIKVGWTRGVKIPRWDRGGIRWFDPFCPKILNGIHLTAHLDPALQSRCITVKLLPKLPDEKVAKFRHAIRDERFLTLQRKLKRWSIDHMPVVVEANPVMPAALDDRQHMNWELQFAIADLAGPEWAKRARAAAIKLSPREESSPGKRFLAAFRDIFRQNGRLLTSKQVEQLLAAYGDGEWANYKNGRPINKWEIARLLKPYDIAPGFIHPRGRPADRGYDASWFETAFKHFLPPETPSDDRAVVRNPRKKPQK